MTKPTSMDQQFIEKLTSAIDANLHREDFGVAELASELGMSRVTLHRKVKSIIKKSVSEFIRETRLEKSFDLLKNRTGTISEIAYSVGFSSPNYFSKCFHKHFGFAPGDVLKGVQPIKAKPEKVKGVGTSFSKKLVRIGFFALILAIISVFAFIVYPQKSEKTTLAILVFDEPDSQNNYLRIFRGLLHDKLGDCENLSLIPDIASGSVENDWTKIGKFATKENVDYILCGEKIIVDNDSTIRLQLIDLKTDSQVWSEYFPEILNNIYKYLPEIALTITKELNVELSKAEIAKLEEKPSDNFVALNYYEAGINLMYAQEHGLRGEHILAQKMFEKALQYDPTISEAYTQLAHIYIDFKNFWSLHDLSLNVAYVDSGKIMAQKALKYDNKNAWAWSLLGWAYNFQNNKDSANHCYSQHAKYAKKDYVYWEGLTHRFARIENHYETINKYLQYLKAKPEKYLTVPATYKCVIDRLAMLGFIEESNIVLKELLTQMNLMIFYTVNQGLAFTHAGQIDSAKYYYHKTLKSIPDHNFALEQMMVISYEQKDYTKAKSYMDLFEKGNPYSDTYPHFYKSLIFLRTGDYEEADYYLTKSIQRNKDLITHNRTEAVFAYKCQVDLATMYCARNETKKALEFIKECRQAESNFAWIYHELNNRHDFDKIRQTYEFIETLNYIKKNYTAEREKVKKLLKIEGLL